MKKKDKTENDLFKDTTEVVTETTPVQETLPLIMETEINVIPADGVGVLKYEPEQTKEVDSVVVLKDETNIEKVPPLEKVVKKRLSKKATLALTTDAATVTGETLPPPTPEKKVRKPATKKAIEKVEVLPAIITDPSDFIKDEEPFIQMNDTQMDINEIKAQYFNDDALLLRPIALYRLDGAGLRNYYTYTPPNGTLPAFVKFYISVTSLIKATTPTSPYLIDWMKKQGENADVIMYNRADYGTMMHIEFEKVLIELINGGFYDLDEVCATVIDYVQCNDVKDADINQWTEDLKQDILGFCKFIFDYNVRPLAIEMALKSDALGVGGAIDFFGLLDIDVKGYFGETYKTGANAGQEKESKQRQTFLAIVDFKSSRKGVHEDHEIQLKAYEECIRENFPQYKETPIKLFNYRPKNWQKAPDYVLTDQTGKHSLEEIQLLSKIFFLKNDLDNREKTLIGGVVDFQKRNINKNFRRVRMNTLIIDKNNNK